MINKKALRFIQKRILHFQKVVIFKTSHISPGGKIALFGSLICFISLFFPWMESLGSIIPSWDSQINSFNSFSSVLGRTGFFILISLIIVSFSIFSIRKKEKLRYFSLLSVSEYMCTSFGSIFIFLLSLQSFFLSSGLQLFSSNIIYWKGIILSITWAIIIFFWSIVIKKEYRINIKWSYISDTKWSPDIPQEAEQKNNMKLPF